MSFPWGSQLQGYLDTCEKSKSCLEEMETITSLTMTRKLYLVASSRFCFLLGLACSIPVVVAWDNNSLGRLQYLCFAFSWKKDLINACFCKPLGKKQWSHQKKRTNQTKTSKTKQTQLIQNKLIPNVYLVIASSKITFEMQKITSHN